MFVRARRCAGRACPARSLTSSKRRIMRGFECRKTAIELLRSADRPRRNPLPYAFRGIRSGGRRGRSRAPSLRAGCGSLRGSLRRSRCDWTRSMLLAGCVKRRLFRVVGAARERARDDLHEALRVADRLEGARTSRGDEFFDFEMALGRLQVLAHGEDVDADRARRRPSSARSPLRFRPGRGISEVLVYVTLPERLACSRMLSDWR